MLEVRDGVREGVEQLNKKLVAVAYEPRPELDHGDMWSGRPEALQREREQARLARTPRAFDPEHDARGARLHGERRCDPVRDGRDAEAVLVVGGDRPVAVEFRRHASS